MTDRELLELAAKAAGYTHVPSVEIACGVRTQGWFIKETDAEPIKEERWNPLTDDGDALRLAVKLNMHVNVDGEEEYGKVTEVYVDPRTELSEPHSTNPYAATRRAIVMAAAKVGEELT